MKRVLNISFICLMAVVFAAGCASSKKMAEPHPLAGMWDFSVDTPQGVYNGVVSIMEGEDGLMGTMTNEALSGTIDLSGITFENNQVSFKFDTGEYGMATFSADVMDNKINGAISLDGVGEMPVSGQKKTDM